MAKTAYSSAGRPTRTARDVEFEAFARITHRIKAAAAGGPVQFSSLAQALHDNRRLWTMLASDVSDKDNSLPPALRARIFYLAEFTFKHTSKVLARQASPDVLIDINTAIMRGLRPAGVQG
ncbi:flagellar biosynthesis regulator FlaF [Phaeovulum vinaykumarii]|nr:flagellar biosynthesis regulator FlaF [Phaeovulum vinaykumarii]